MPALTSQPTECPRCGACMRPAVVRTAIWAEDRLCIIEDVPAQVCDSCGERFYDEETTEALRRMKEEGFPNAHLKHEILVPVFSLMTFASSTL